MQGPENQQLLNAVNVFAENMRVMRSYHALVEKLYYNRHRKGWFLDAAHIYRQAVIGLSLNLSAADLKSRGFSEFRNYLAAYTESHEFMRLVSETETLKTGLSDISYCLIIKGG